MVTITNSKPKTNIRHIEELERYVNLVFPEQYKAHLLRFNGGRPRPNIFTFLENGTLNSSDVHWFLAICDGTWESLRWNIDVLKINQKRMPSHVLPIGDDSGGNAICISCRGRDSGMVYFWDHEREVDYRVSDDGDYSNLYPIAQSFNEFLEHLVTEREVA